MNIVHIVRDEKFVNVALDAFEQFGKNHCNEFYIIADKDVNLFFLNKERVRVISADDIVAYSNTYADVVIMHTLHALPIKYFNLFSSRIRLVWLSVGYDLYYWPHKQCPFINLKLYHKETSKLLWNGWKNYITELRSLLYYLRIEKKMYEDAISRVDFFSSVIPEEYLMIKKNSFFRASYLEFMYGFIRKDDIKKNNEMNSSNILIGNSCDPSNNHIDVLKKLYKMRLNDIHIYMPISYGGTPSYKESVKKTGKRLFGDNIHYLDDFLSYDEYKNIVSSCGTFIFCHERQQALGNIYIGIINGAKVFMSDTSILYKHLVGKGFRIYSIQKELNSEELNKKMLDLEIQNNHNLIIETRGTAHQKEVMDSFYKALEKT